MRDRLTAMMSTIGSVSQIELTESGRRDSMRFFAIRANQPVLGGLSKGCGGRVQEQRPALQIDRRNR